MATEIKDLSATATAPASTGRIPWQNTDGTFGSATPAQVVNVGGGAGAASLLVETGSASKISALTAKTTPEPTDEIVVVDNTADPIENKRVTLANAVSNLNVVTAAGTLTSGNVLLGGGSKAAEASSIAGTELVTKTIAPTEYSGTDRDVTDDDNGKVIVFTNVAGSGVTLANNATPGVNAMLIADDGAGDIDIVAEAGGSLKCPAGTAVTITALGVATVYCRSNSGGNNAVWFVGGDVEATV